MKLALSIVVAWYLFAVTFSFTADTEDSAISLRSSIDGIEVRLPRELLTLSKMLQLQVDTMGEKIVREQGASLEIEGPTLTRIVNAMITRVSLDDKASFREIKNAIAMQFADVYSLDEINKFFHAINFLDIKDFFEPTAQLLLDSVARLVPSDLTSSVKSALAFSELNSRNLIISSKFSFPASGFARSKPYAVGDKIIFGSSDRVDIFDKEKNTFRRLLTGLLGSRMVVVGANLCIGMLDKICLFKDDAVLSKIFETNDPQIASNGSEYINLIGTTLFATKEGSSSVSVIDTKENALRRTITFDNGEGKIYGHPLHNNRFLLVLIITNKENSAMKLFAIDSESDNYEAKEISLPAKGGHGLHSVLENKFIIRSADNGFVVDTDEKEMGAKPFNLPQDFGENFHLVEISKTRYLAICTVKSCAREYLLFDPTTGNAHPINLPLPGKEAQFLGRIRDSIIFLENSFDNLSVIVLDRKSSERQSFSLGKIPNFESALLVDSELIIKFEKFIKIYDLKLIF